MKAQFNGLCNRCKTFKPRCAFVYLRVGGAFRFYCQPSILCEDCRRDERGKYRLDAKHK